MPGTNKCMLIKFYIYLKAHLGVVVSISYYCGFVDELKTIF